MPMICTLKHYTNLYYQILNQIIVFGSYCLKIVLYMYEKVFNLEMIS